MHKSCKIFDPSLHSTPGSIQSYHNHHTQRNSASAHTGKMSDPNNNQTEDYDQDDDLQVELCDWDEEEDIPDEVVIVINNDDEEEEADQTGAEGLSGSTTPREEQEDQEQQKPNEENVQNFTTHRTKQ
nr:myelin transcription factor 1-like protein [Procambarus clarkii]